jgi:superfamily II RNA helicase
VTALDGDVEITFTERYRFPFDRFQIEAMVHIRRGSSVMVAAPTSAGKTVIAEYALWQSLNRGRRALYTTPIKALSNQKRQELEVLYPGQVGLLTGDRSENRDADVVVMTTEVLRNMLLEDPASVSAVDCVIFDEVHYLADPDRGTIWEESIISCPRRIQLVCLSATVANAEEIADWIGETHGQISLVRHDERPVPLEHYAFAGGALRLIRNSAGKRVANVPRLERRGHARSAFASPDDVVLALRRAQLLPAIWFAFTRRGVETDAERCAQALPTLSGPAAVMVEDAIERFVEGLPPEDRNLDQITGLCDLLRHGVGFHHAGILPPCKELVENLFGRGVLSVVCATDTLSVGINMPARTVVISSMSRPVAGLLTPNDFSQLTGRAGRRGIDDRGAVVLLPTPFHDFERSYALLTGPLEPIRSAFTLRYSTLLSVFVGDHPEERLATLVASSLRQFQLYGDAALMERELATVEAVLGDLHGDETLQGQLEAYLAIQSRLTAAERRHHGDRSGKMTGHSRRAKEKRRKAAPGPERSMKEVLSLRELLRSHLLHQHISDPEFQAAHAQTIELLRQRNRLRRAIETSRRERDRSADLIARGVTAVLKRLGYVRDERLTAKAAGLKEIVAPCGIVLSEMYHDGMLQGLAPGDLAEVVSWFANDADRRRYNSFRLPHHLRSVRSMSESMFLRISGVEEGERIRLAQGPSGWFWGVALAWCQGQSIGDISRSIELADGDIVSALNKTVDLLDQMKGMLTAYHDEALLRTMARARGLLNRGMVALIRTEGPMDIDVLATLTAEDAECSPTPEHS